MLFVCVCIGAIVVLDAQGLHTLREQKKAKTYITDLQFAHNGEMIAATSGDGRIYVINITTLVTIAAIDLSLRRPAVRVDFDTTNTILRIVYYADRLLYYNLVTAKLENSPLLVRDSHYATTSCAYMWNTQGNETLIVDYYRVLNGERCISFCVLSRCIEQCPTVPSSAALLVHSFPRH